MCNVVQPERKFDEVVKTMSEKGMTDSQYLIPIIHPPGSFIHLWDTTMSGGKEDWKEVKLDKVLIKYRIFNVDQSGLVKPQNL